MKRAVAAGVVNLLISTALFDSGHNLTMAETINPNSWAEVPVPGEGEDRGWVLARGSDITTIAMSPDGTLYAAAAGLEDALFKSIDGGYSWAACGNIGAEIIDIQADPEESGAL